MFQPDAGVDLADGADGGRVVSVGPPSNQGVPVSGLGGLGGLHVAGAREKAPEDRRLLDLTIEAGEGPGQGLAQNGLNGPIGRRRFSQAHKGHALRKIIGGHCKSLKI